MDWENERYVRRYTRETVDDAVLSWEARALWDALMIRFDRAGVLSMGVHGWKGVALLVRMPLDVVAPASEELIVDGRIQIRGNHIIAPNFMEAQEAKQSDKQRKAESRARQRDQVMAEQLGVTFCDQTGGGESQNVTDKPDSVTPGHTQSRLVTPTLPDPSLAVPSRAYLKEGQRAKALAFSKAAISKLNSLVGSKYKPDSKQTLSDCETLTKEKYTEDQAIAVIAAKVAEWQGTDYAKNLRPSTLLRPTNFRRYLADTEGAPQNPAMSGQGRSSQNQRGFSAEDLWRMSEEQTDDEKRGAEVPSDTQS